MNEEHRDPAARRPETPGHPGRVIVAMSGGVDSAVTAALLSEQGYECIGVTMKVWPSFLPAGGAEGGCCGLGAVEDARGVAFRLGIRWYVLNFGEVFTETVIEPFCRGYLAGQTPNPCILCNRDVKWRALLQKARELDADYLATGHYARRGVSAETGRYTLRRAADPSKDQSYVLYNLTQEQLAATLFPLGDLPKSEVRRLAAERGLAVAAKPDSQEICFVTDGDYRTFLQEYTGASIDPGPFLDLEGREIGQHRGLPFYTVGQRKGLGLPGGPFYVVRLDPERNAVIVGRERDLYRRELSAVDVNWVSVAAPREPLRVEAKIRYRVPPAPAVLTPFGETEVRLHFTDSQRAITPGQAVVFYQGDLVLGGGTIAEVF